MTVRDVECYSNVKQYSVQSWRSALLSFAYMESHLIAIFGLIINNGYLLDSYIYADDCAASGCVWGALNLLHTWFELINIPSLSRSRSHSRSPIHSSSPSFSQLIWYIYIYVHTDAHRPYATIDA